MEVELKYRLSAELGDFLPWLDQWVLELGGRPREAWLRDYYYALYFVPELAGSDLAGDEAYVYRLRQEGQALCLTVKWKIPAVAERQTEALALSRRGEWNCPLPELASRVCPEEAESQGLDPCLLEELRSCLKSLGADDRRWEGLPLLARQALELGSYQALFVSAFWRSHRRFYWAENQLEWALDYGELRAGPGLQRREPIAELELESLEGPEQTLLRLDCKLRKELGLEAETRSKYQRLCSLAEG